MTTKVEDVVIMLPTMVSSDDLPDKYCILQNSSSKPHIGRERYIDRDDGPYGWTSGLCGRQARTPTSDRHQVAPSHICRDCLYQMNEILQNCFYDSEKEQWYDPRRE